MSKKDLSQLYCLDREIKMQKKRLSELESKVISCSMNISGMPQGKGVFDKVGEYGAEIADLRELIELNIKRCFHELNRITRYINAVDDSFIRGILTARYVMKLSWTRVAAEVGGNNTSDSVRKAHDRFLSGN
jgi:hypothetical protein